MLWLKTISDGIRKVNDSNSICNYKPFFFGVALFNPNYENHLPITIEGSLNAGANGN